MKFDFLVVGSGLFGATFAQQASSYGKNVIVIEKRNHIGGNVFTEEIDGIQVHKYGPHIFHTNDPSLYAYMCLFDTLEPFTNTPIANYHGKLYSLPFSMRTFYEMWGITSPLEAKRKIEQQIKNAGISTPKNLEEKAISLVGQEIYEKLIKGYTEKQWGRKCSELPASIINRIPVRFNFNTNYFNDLFQGIPKNGYTHIIEKMLCNSYVIKETDYFDNKKEFDSLAKKIIYTGAIDEYYQYEFGHLDYRSLRFETKKIDVSDFQGNAVVNYTDKETPYTRIIEHKHFYENPKCTNTIITKEYPCEYKDGNERCYPVCDEKNINLYQKYKKLTQCEKNIVFGGRLGEYKYYNMDEVIKSAMDTYKQVY